VVTNEVVEDIRRRKKSGFIIKIDYEKTYDSVMGIHVLHDV